MRHNERDSDAADTNPIGDTDFSSASDEPIFVVLVQSVKEATKSLDHGCNYDNIPQPTAYMSDAGRDILDDKDWQGDCEQQDDARDFDASENCCVRIFGWVVVMRCFMKRGVIPGSSEDETEDVRYNHQSDEIPGSLTGDKGVKSDEKNVTEEICHFYMVRFSHSGAKIMLKQIYQPLSRCIIGLDNKQLTILLYHKLLKKSI